MKRLLAPAVAMFAYAGLYLLALLQLAQSAAVDTGEYLAVLLIFGLGFSAAAWLASIRVPAQALVVRQARPELATVTLYLAAFALLFLGWGLSALKAAAGGEQLQELLVLLAKLLTMVALPAWLFHRRGYRWHDLVGRFTLASGHWRVLLIMAVLLLGLQLSIGRGPAQLAALGESTMVIIAVAPLALLWMTLEAGLTEEFLFRVLLQTRLATWLRSETAAIVLMAIVFALVHAPGYVLRGAHSMEGMSSAPDVLTAIAYALVVVSPIGLMFGVLWARTRNFWLLVLLHGWTDLLPNLAPFIKTWLH